MTLLINVFGYEGDTYYSFEAESKEKLEEEFLAYLNTRKNADEQYHSYFETQFEHFKNANPHKPKSPEYRKYDEDAYQKAAESSYDKFYTKIEEIYPDLQFYGFDISWTSILGHGQQLYKIITLEEFFEDHLPSKEEDEFED